MKWIHLKNDLTLNLGILVLSQPQLNGLST